MISIRRFINRGEDESVLWQVISLLLEKIASEAVQGDRSECAMFARNIERVRDSVASATTPEALLVTVGSAIKAMAEHKQRVARYIQRQRSELQAIVAMLTDSVVKISGENTRFAQSFQEIGGRMERAVALEDLQDLKLHLRECLRDFNSEALKQKKEMEELITALQQEVDRSRAGIEPPQDTDPATGLLLQEAAEAAMFKALKSGPNSYVITLVVSRLQSINARFGYEVGDQMLRICRENVEKHLLPGDQMFRWAGPAIVLLLERAETLDVVRGQLKRILDARVEQTFLLGSRSVMIPISMAWSSFKLVSAVGVAVRQIQTFIASQSPRDFA